MKWDQPKPATPLDIAFGPSSLSDYLPDLSEIPDEFTHHHGTPWNEFVTRWFFHGIKCHLTPRDGIDLRAALNHIAVCLRSFEPSHEHKEAGCAYLASLWLDESTLTEETL